MSDSKSEILSVERANTGKYSCTIVTVRIDEPFDFDNKTHTAALLRQLRSAHNLFSDEQEKGEKPLTS